MSEYYDKKELESCRVGPSKPTGASTKLTNYILLRASQTVGRGQLGEGFFGEGAAFKRWCREKWNGRVGKRQTRDNKKPPPRKTVQRGLE